MTDRERAKIVNKILLGIYYCEVNNKTYVIKNPTIKQKIELDNFYEEILADNLFNGWLTEKQCHGILMRRGILPIRFEDSIKELEKKIEDLKVDLYKSHINPVLLTRVRKQLADTNKTYFRLLENKNLLQHITAEYFAEAATKQKQILDCVYDDAGNKIDDLDFTTFNIILYQLTEYFHGIDVLREISRTEPWRSVWVLGKPNPFNCHLSDLNDTQKTLIGLSRMYDSAFEHPECPDESVINDDDMFDGWMIHQRRQNLAHKMENKTNKLLNKPGYANKEELYLKATSREEAQKVDDLNNQEAKITKKKREILLKNKEIVDERELPDVRDKYRQQALAGRTDAVKARKGK